MSCTTRLGNHEALLHGSGMVWLPELKLLCASDIHLEKGSFFRRFGSLLPPYDTQDTLEKLARGIAQFQPDIVVALGDSFHDASAGERMDASVKNRLNALIAQVPDWRWVMGNHDPAIDASIGGTRCEETEAGGIRFRHETEGGDIPEVSGHYHPKAALRIGGHRISGPCFVQRGQRLVLPAFGSFTGGLDVNSADFLQVVPREQRRLFLLHQERVYGLAG